MSLRRPTVVVLLFTFVISPVCDVAQRSDCGISFKALSVMSPRRPTVANLLFTFVKALSVMSRRRPTAVFLLKPCL